jgi:hypothetical protein
MEQQVTMRFVVEVAVPAEQAAKDGAAGIAKTIENVVDCNTDRWLVWVQLVEGDGTNR